MQIIQNNPYRIIGLLVGATAREQEKQVKRLKLLIEAEQAPNDDFSFPALGNLNRTVNTIDIAASQLNLNEDKVNAALFWFWNGNDITDSLAFDALKSGDFAKANQLWEKLIFKINENGTINWYPVSTHNYSAFHNFSILNIIKSNGKLHEAVIANLYFLENSLVENFITSFADITHKTSGKELQLRFLNLLHSDIENYNKLLIPLFLKILTSVNFLAKQDFLSNYVDKCIERIKQKIELAQNKTKLNKGNGAIVGNELLTSTAEEFNELKSIIGQSDIKFSDIADKVASEVLLSSLDYYKDCKEKNSSEDYASTTLELARKAESFAVSNPKKVWIGNNIYEIEKEQFPELVQAIQHLQAIKTYCDSNIPINWITAVDIIKKDIPPQNIPIIQNTRNKVALEKYKTLVIFVLSKIAYSQKRNIRYLNFWEKPGSFSTEPGGVFRKIKENFILVIFSIFVALSILKTCN